MVFITVPSEDGSDGVVDVGVSLRDYFDNQTLRGMSDVKGVVLATRESKIRCAGYAARLADAGGRRTSPVISAGKKTNTWTTSKAMKRVCSRNDGCDWRQTDRTI